VTYAPPAEGGINARILALLRAPVPALEAVERAAPNLRSGRGVNLESIVGYPDCKVESATNKLQECNSSSLHPPLVEVELWSVAVVYGPGWSSTSTQS
jgi:hypothetical protein